MSFEKKYRGLKNQGATCYMNSLLQTLFMTPEFRQQMYQYRHNEQHQADRIDSIPYQLQQIFLRLQSEGQRVETKKLIKSFQWTQSQSFEQHDVQQFCRVLFESIQTSQNNSDWIKNLYQGTIVSYIKCDNGHQSQKYEKFLDISLTIKNPYENIEHHSLEEALKSYLKTEKLDYDNKYNCEKCGQKVPAEKGLRLEFLPSILTIQLSRFQLNYETMLREKINQFVHYPEILELWRFQKPYNDIIIKEVPKELMQNARKKQYKPKKESSRNSQWVEFTTNQPPRKKSEQKQGNQKEFISFVDDQNLHKKKNIELTQQQKKLRNIEMLRNLQLTKGEIDEKYNRIESKKNKKKEQKKQQKPQPIIVNKNNSNDFDLDPLIFGIGGQMIAQATNWQDTAIVSKQNNNSIEEKNQQKEKYIHNEEKYDPTKEYSPNTYILYAVLVHEGGALGGHYYAYINDGIDWYKFNDSNVSKVDRSQIWKYGDAQDQKYGGSAYMLFYRNVSTMQQIHQIPIPEDLKIQMHKEIEAQLQETKNNNQNQNIINASEKTQLQRLRQMQQFQGAKLKIRVYRNSTTSEIIDDLDRFTMRYQQLRTLVQVLFNIQESEENWRLRRYNHYEDTSLDPFGNDLQTYNKTLAQLGMRDTVDLIVQTKTSQEIFQIYDPRQITLKINVWREGLTILSQSHLNPIKIKIKDDAPLTDLLNIIKQIIKLDDFIVLRRTFASGANSYQIITKEENHRKTLLNLRFFNSLNLFVQPKRQATKLLWQEQFESQKHRFLVKFNNPFVDNSEHEFYFDNRKTFNDLKLKLSEFIKLSINQFRVKRSNKTQPEIVEYKKRLIDLRMIHSQNLYLEIGRSTKGLIKICKGLVLDNQDALEFVKHEQEEYEMENSKTVLHLKQEIAKKHDSLSDYIRIREFKTGRFGQIYKDSEFLQKISKNLLIWEEVCETSRGISIYIRKFTPESLFLGRMQEIFLQYDASYEEFAMILSETFEIPPQKLVAYSVNSNLFQKQQLIEAHWHNLYSIEGKISDPPFYITLDGYYIIIKQGDRVYPKSRRHISSSINQSPYLSYAPLTSNTRGKQKALKITVKTKKAEQKIQASQQQQSKTTTQFPQKIEQSTILRSQVLSTIQQQSAEDQSKKNENEQKIASSLQP